MNFMYVLTLTLLIYSTFVTIEWWYNKPTKKPVCVDRCIDDKRHSYEVIDAISNYSNVWGEGIYSITIVAKCTKCKRTKTTVRKI